MMRLAILGASGSIGRQTLDVVRMHPELFSVYALSVGHNERALRSLCEQFRPKYAAIKDEKVANRLGQALTGVDFLSGKNANAQICMIGEVDAVVIALPGMEAIFALLAAAKAGKRIALANKECIVCGGTYVQEYLQRYDAKVYPIDSEQSAIFQCMQGIRSTEITRLILTASGGPFRDWTNDQMRDVTVDQALAHPNWSMGPKITIDSASLVNKGLEVIEARYLFDVPPERIQVTIHPQSIVHSMVETCDGAIIAQMGEPDMRLAIQYALTHPNRIASPAPNMNFEKSMGLTFSLPDFSRFPGLRLAYDALELDGTATAVYNAADEVAVEEFLKKNVGFCDITNCIDAALQAITSEPLRDLDTIVESDRQTRRFALEWIAKRKERL